MYLYDDEDDDESWGPLADEAERDEWDGVYEDCDEWDDVYEDCDDW